MSIMKVTRRTTAPPGPPHRERPVHLLYDHQVPNDYRQAALEAIRTVLFWAEMSDLPILDQGHEGVEQALKTSRTRSNRDQQLNAQFIFRPFFPPEGNPHFRYIVLITMQDLYDSNGPDGSRFNLGAAQEKFGAVVGASRFGEFPSSIRMECFRSVIMHELAHVFDVPDNTRSTNLQNRLGLHCTNPCIVRPGSYDFVDHWQELTRDRLELGPFCPLCLDELRRFFL